MRNTFYNLCNVKYGIAERNFLSLRCIKLQISFRISIAFRIGDLGFDSRANQIGHSVAYGSPPLQRFSSVVRSCVGQALIDAETSHAIHYIFGRNTR